ncbi:MarR family transcriptional regulator, organic hydroperoxide resistance regulator [Azospirillaceae bacterium]
MAGKSMKMTWMTTLESNSIDESPAAMIDSTVGYLVRDLHRAFLRNLQTRIANHGVSMGQWFFLRVLWEEDGLTQRELSQRVGMMEPTTVTALNSMERRGLVERVRNMHDRRKINIYLTTKGRTLRDVLMPCSMEVGEMAIRGIHGPDISMVNDVLRQMIKNLNDVSLSNNIKDTEPKRAINHIEWPINEQTVA